MKHYQEVDYWGNTYKLHDKVYILDYYDIKKHYIEDIFDDYFSDDSDYICKCMREGSILAKGKGNIDWDNSVHHVDGRLMSRSETKEKISLKEFRESMNGIYTTCIKESTLSEAPMAYKSLDEIVHNIHDTAEVIDVIRPIYNFKA